MKTIKLFFLIALTSLFFSSCNQEAIRPTVDPALLGSVGAAWSSEILETKMVTEDNNTISVGMYRSLTGAAATVPISIKGATEFTLSSTNAVFEAGSATTNVVVSYSDINSLSQTEKYEFTLAITDSTLLSPSLFAEIKVIAQR